MWLSNRDFCQAVERSVLAESVGFAVLNLMSNNPGMRWDYQTRDRLLADGWRRAGGHGRNEG